MLLHQEKGICPWTVRCPLHQRKFFDNHMNLSEIEMKINTVTADRHYHCSLSNYLARHTSEDYRHTTGSLLLFVWVSST